jgi:hypothetical protein
MKLHMGAQEETIAVLGHKLAGQCLTHWQHLLEAAATRALVLAPLQAAAALPVQAAQRPWHCPPPERGI